MLWRTNGRKNNKKKWQRAGVLALLVAAVLGLVVGLSFRRSTEPPSDEPIFIEVVWPDGSQSPVALEEFLLGVVAAEMPATFHPQALQAQAVAARTYILRQNSAGKHGTAAVCCDSTCCQAWLSQEELVQRWGAHYPQYWNKLQEAVEATSGQVLTWEGELIDGVFCSTCGGMTEDVAEVWGGSRPYLTAHPCGYCAHSPRYINWQRYTLAEAAALLGAEPDQVREMTALSSTAGGRVATLSAGDQQWRGTEVRSKLGLDSAAFSWLIQGDDLVVMTLGFGHGAGMCQYGADGMGKAGYTCQEILAFYYPGTELVEF